MGTAVATPVFTAWPVFRAAHAWYVLCDRLPPRHADFTENAHRAGLLREDGISSRFRHALVLAALLRPEGGRT